MSLTVNAGEAETVGEPDEGKLHVRFDEGRLGTDRLRVALAAYAPVGNRRGTLVSP